MNFFHQKMQICPEEVYLHFQIGLQWGGWLLEKPLHEIPMLVMGSLSWEKTITSKGLFITVPQLPHPKNQDAFSLCKPCKPLSPCPRVKVEAGGFKALSGGAD